MNYIIKNSDSKYDEEINKIISDRQAEIFDFFNSIEKELSCNIYIYDNQEELVNGLKERGFGEFPKYMCACFKDEDNSLNFFEPKDNPSDNEWSKEEYKRVIFHELIHAIQYNLFGYSPEWLCEGIAKYLDGTYSKRIKWLLDNYINNNPIPKQYEIEEEFGMHEYDSYVYAYLMVSYLIETLNKNKFIEVLKNNEINKYKDNLLNKSINYYNNKFNLNKLQDYLNQDIDNPIYLFHGSPKKLSIISPKQSHDSSGNENNVSEAVFLFPSFLKSTSYAFKDTIKENSLMLEYNFEIPNNNEFPLMKMENVNVDDDIIGYIYVFKKEDDMIKDDRSYQYKCYNELVPLDVVEVKYKDFKQYFEVNNNYIKTK